MNKLKITKCKWHGVKYAGYYEIQPTEKYGGNSLIDANVTPEADDNVILCCDAGNTYQQCGLMPSELLEQRDELLQTLKQIERGVTGLSLQALQTIDSIEKQENETK